MTGPARIPTDDKDQSIPSLMPNSLVGLIAPVLAATSVIQAPLANPYATIPTTTAAGGMGAEHQNAKIDRAHSEPMVTNIFQTPNRSARMPERTRPKKEPDWRMAIE